MKNKKKRLFLLIFLIILFLAIASFIFFRFFFEKQDPSCSEDEALYRPWKSRFARASICIPDPMGCHLLIKEGELRNEECDKREDCFTPCYSSCYTCENPLCSGCIPKNYRDYL